MPNQCFAPRPSRHYRPLQVAFRRSVVKAHPSNDRSPGAQGRSARGFDRLYSFHTTRDTSVTAVYRMTRDLFLAQRFARHLSPLTTVVYTHPSLDFHGRELP